MNERRLAQPTDAQIIDALKRKPACRASREAVKLIERLQREVEALRSKEG